MEADDPRPPHSDGIVPPDYEAEGPDGDHGSDTAAKPNRRRLIGRIALVALAIGAIYGVYAFVQYRTVGRYMQETDDAYVRADAVTVSSKLAGYVAEVAVGDNQDVRAGQLLVQVSPTDFANKVAEANAQIAASEAARRATLSGLGEAQGGIVQAEAGLAAAQRELAYLEREVARYRPLAASGAEPKTTLDQLVSNRDKAAADVRARTGALEAARSRIATIRSQADAGGAQIEQARVQRRLAETDLAAARLVAPIAGTVASRTVRVGQYVQPGQPLLSVVPTEALYVEANFKETQIGLMRPGQPVTMKVDALSGVEFHGTVESITPGTGANFSLIPPQNATGNFTKIVQRVPVRIRIKAGPESKKVLVPGLSVSVEVDTRAAKPELEKIQREQDK